MKIEKQKTILITGASSGIGRAIALRLAHRVSNLKLLARREDKLKEVKEELLKINSKLQVELIICDINRPDLISFLEKENHLDVGILISNAGLALSKDFVLNAKWEHFETMIQTNFTTLVKLTHAVLPYMMKNGFGDIIHVSSVAAHTTYQGGAVYCATKQAVWAFTKSLREETCGNNIRVMQISPGMVESDFSMVRFGQNKNLADQVYQGMTPLTPEDIARHVDFMLEEPRHVTIDEITTMPTDQGSVVTVKRK